MAHAILSPSGASRWMACTPSARLEQQFPDKAGEAAAEGTLAHSIGELLLRWQLGQLGEGAFNTKWHEYHDDKRYEEAMHDYCQSYADFVLERYADAKRRNKDAMIFLEKKIDLTQYIEEGFGTGDAFIIADETLDFIDLKYGKGVPVSAVENKQMMVYALGALHEFELMFDIKKVRMTIYQPRIDNISEWEISVEDLKAWAASDLVPKAKLAYAGEGEFVPGPHCLFCRAKAVCKANAEAQLEVLKHEFRDAVLLTDEEVADILTKADTIEKWLKAVEAHALTEAVNNGKQWPGFKLVEGRSVRVITDTDKVEDKLLSAGYKTADIQRPAELLGITALEKVVGKKKFEELLKDFVIKPAGKPTLVPLADKRPPLNSLETAKLDFADVDIEE